MPWAVEYSIDFTPNAASLAAYLSMSGARTPEVDALLTAACAAAVAEISARLDPALMETAGAGSYINVPDPVARAMLMRAAALYRRANSVNGYDGYDDLGTVAVRASDPDIERLIDPFRRWTLA